MQESRSGLKRQKISREVAGHDSTTVNGVYGYFACSPLVEGVGSKRLQSNLHPLF